MILSISISTSILFASELSNTGCSSSVSKESYGCNSKSLLVVEKKNVFKIQEENLSQQSKQTNISESLHSISVNHKGKELRIIRNIIDDQKSCPPYCIVPMSIKGVRTVGELETLDFLKSLKEKGNSLVLDTRESRYYNEATIPGALNLPSHMLLEDSKYFSDVLSVLGIKKVDGSWQINEIRDLLIFDDGITDNKASKAIKSLLKLSYPSDKIFYYRGGFRSWKDLGLTTIKK
jgi:rhodanese-related sulfurtransferase